MTNTQVIGDTSSTFICGNENCPGRYGERERQTDRPTDRQTGRERKRKKEEIKYGEKM